MRKNYNYKVWLPGSYKKSYYSKLWRNLDSTTKRKLLLRSSISPTLEKQDFSDLHTQQSSKCFESLLSLIIEYDLDVVIRVLDIGGSHYKVPVPKSLDSVLQYSIKGNLLYYSEGYLYSTDSRVVSVPRLSILGGSIKRFNNSCTFTSNDLLMFDGRWLLHLSDKIRGDLLNSSVPTSFKGTTAHNLKLIPLRV